MHPALKPVQFLIGSWQSIKAKGQFPNINDFSYDETITFESIGQPLLVIYEIIYLFTFEKLLTSIFFFRTSKAFQK